MGRRAAARADLDARAKQAFNASKQHAGSPRLTRDLADAGCFHDRKTIAKSLQKLGLRAKPARRLKATTYSAHGLPVAPNLLQQHFSAEAPDRKWVSDISYLWTDEGWLYLVVVVDLCSRMVVGWSMSERITAPLVCDALNMALWRRGKPRGVIVHSDRGSQYCSKLYQQLLRGFDSSCSMSGKGNCYDNAPAESFFHAMKVELIHGERFTNRELLKQVVFEYIEVECQRTRRHRALGYVSAEPFEAADAA